MDPITFRAALGVAQAVIFGERTVSVADALVLLNWLDDYKPVHMEQHKNGYLTLCYCGRCSTIVQKGDHYCNGCGRRFAVD